MQQQSWWYRSNNKLPIRKALLWIAASIIVITVPITIGILYYQYHQERKTFDSRYDIIALTQTGPEREQLKTAYLAELLDLSVDKPTNLYAFNTQEANKKLLSNPLIKKANIKKVSPGTVFVDYTIRTPLAFVGDYTNTAIDDEGVLFPFKPFYSPKKLPEIIFGDHAFNSGTVWGMAPKQNIWALAIELHSVLSAKCQKENIQLKSIDISDAYADSYGKRGIIITITDQLQRKAQLIRVPAILRLSTDDYRRGIANYFEFRKHILKQAIEKSPMTADTHTVTMKTVTLDLRAPNIAFLGL